MGLELILLNITSASSLKTDRFPQLEHTQWSSTMRTGSQWKLFWKSRTGAKRERLKTHAPAY